MRVEADCDGVERGCLAKIKCDPRVLVSLRLAERGSLPAASGACIDDRRIVTRVENLDGVVVDGILQLATHALAAVRYRLHGERVAAHVAGDARRHVVREAAGKEDARRL